MLVYSFSIIALYKFENVTSNSSSLKVFKMQIIMTFVCGFSAYIKPFLL